MLTIGGLELGILPRIAVPMSDTEARQDAGAARALADVFELRIDRFARHDPGYTAEICREVRAHRVPLIATVRAAEEGGEGSLDDTTRLAIFQAVAPVVDAFDIEFRSPIREQVLQLGQATHNLVIVSHHDFERTPADGELSAIIDAAKSQGADIVKLAVFARQSVDVDRLLGVLRHHRDQHLIAIAMGPYGAASRIFFPLIGSLLTYGFLHQAVAPGQLALSELVTELRRYSPDFARKS